MIALCGPDGAGKTTVATKLLEREGANTRRYWLRGTHTLAYVLAKLLTKFEPFRGDTSFYLHLSIPKGVEKLWQLLEFVSILPHLIAIRLLKIKYTVICERSLPDFAVWVRLLTRDPAYVHTLQFRALRGLSRQDIDFFYLTASLEALERRSGESSSFLKRQLLAYERITHYFDVDRIDTTGKSVEETVHEIEKRLSGN